MKGRGLLNTVINNLPFELHLPGYNYCGPGTKLQKRLSRGDRGINPLDDACMQHDIAYTKYTNLEDRHKADLELKSMAKRRLRSVDAGTGEKIASWLVNRVMKAKLKSGAGVKHFKAGISKLKTKLKKYKPKNDKAAIKFAHVAAKKMFSKSGVSVPRVIPLPKTGGLLPLIPIFAGLSALGSLAGGAAGIAKAVNDSKTAQKKFTESVRHNKMLEAITLGKGLYIKPYKKGNGLYLHSSKN